MENTQYTFGSLFAGIGGICIGFSQGGFQIKWANEWDKFACATYRNNEYKFSPGLEITEGDVCNFNPDQKIDVLGAGFPCQPYSIAGNRKGLNDKRGKPMFEEIIRIAKQTSPRAIFLENVGNLKTFDKGRTFPILMKMLEDAGYIYHHDTVLNSKDYSGIAQFRNRIYIVAFKEKQLSETYQKLFPQYIKKKPQTKKIDRLILPPKQIPLKYYYSKDDSKKCISIRYEEHFLPNVTETGVFYQYRRRYMRRNQSGLCPALTASMGQGGHNVPIILDDYGIRKLTPKECLRVQGFPAWFQFPEKMADGHKYKQAGNSVTIPVIKQFALLIHYTLESVDNSNQQ